MKYMLLLYSNPTTWEALSEDDRVALAREHNELINELIETGEWIGGSPLADPSTTTTVRVKDGIPAYTDGPLLEAKEHLAGYDLVDCDSAERAAAIAARIPDAKLVAVEVRRLMDDSGMEM